MTRTEKQRKLANRLTSLQGTINQLQSSIDSVLELQAVKYLETRDNTLFRLLEVQTELNKQFTECVIEYNNFVDFVEA